MTSQIPFQPGANLYTIGTGTRAENIEVPHFDVRAPTSADVNYVLGKEWIWPNNGVWKLIYLTNAGGVLTATWVELASSTGAVVAVVGTASQVSVSTTAGTATVSLPAAVTAPGSVTATTTLTATLGNITATNGNLVLGTLGNKLVIPAGTNGSVGTTAAMSGSPGTVTVSSTAVTTSSIIIFSRDVTGGVPGQVSITSQTTGSFTLTSTGVETSTFNYLIIN
jgi:hypothetical protein